MAERPATTPGQFAKDVALDINGDGKANGKDLAPGQIAKDIGVDLNGDGKANGKDLAPGKAFK